MYSNHIEHTKKKAFIVIGKNYGDEGKGQQVARFVHSLLEEHRTCLVCKHNGGAQAGHTVVYHDKRYLFHQLGSGTPFGVPTFLCPEYMVDLIQLKAELEGYVDDYGGDLPTVYASENCRVTTIFDVIVNSIAECSRGENRHGSCGMGIYETQVRCEFPVDGLCSEDELCTEDELCSKYELCSEEEFCSKDELHPKYALYMKDVAELSFSELEARLRLIRDEYVPMRLKELGISEETVQSKTCREWVERLQDDQLLKNVAEIMKDAQQYGLMMISDEEMSHFLKPFTGLVFETGQGLLLDEGNEEEYPHVSASKTGCHNALAFLRQYQPEISIGMIELCYVTRSYVTRHGAGRLYCECEREQIGDYMTVDQTNVYNPWQQTIRYAKHKSVDDFVKAVDKDLQIAEQLWMKGRVSLALTHLDETSRKMSFEDGDIPVEVFCRDSRIQKTFQKIYVHESEDK